MRKRDLRGFMGVESLSWEILLDNKRGIWYYEKKCRFAGLLIIEI
jgi:hypothetical protein